MLDVNDETPTFFPAVYNVSVSEDVPREFRVVWLRDLDQGEGVAISLNFLAPPRPQGLAGSFEAEGVLGMGRGDRVLPGASLHPTSEGSHYRNVASSLLGDS